MKTFLITLSLLLTSNLFSQTIKNNLSDTTKIITHNTNVVRGVDISKASPNEQGLINYMETLSDEQALDFLKSFVVGEIVYKEN